MNRKLYKLDKAEDEVFPPGPKPISVESHSFESKRVPFLQLRDTKSWLKYGMETFDLLHSSSTPLIYI